MKCHANGCPMAGTMAGLSSSTWWCAYHKACAPQDLARVTSVLNQHHDLRDIINAGRALLNSNATQAEVRTEWARMRGLLAFAGYTDPTRGGQLGQPVLKNEAATFSIWIYRCETLLGNLVSRTIGARRTLL